jgi:hypothetical protein
MKKHLLYQRTTISDFEVPARKSLEKALEQNENTPLAKNLQGDMEKVLNELKTSEEINMGCSTSF